MLEEAIPLLTLTGPGGIGKTRLALAIAGEVAGSFADGIVFVDLTSLADPAPVTNMIARAAGITADTSLDPEAQLLAALRGRQILLWFDNCEHLLSPVAELTGRLLTGCPALQVLATSRARLRPQGEHELAVPPLSIPDHVAAVSNAHSDAVTLFVHRARAVDPSFTLDATSRSAVVEICRRLNGLPLTIELAASWLRLLTPSALLARLADRLLELTAGPRNLPARQQTLRETIAWSHDLLGEEERVFFRRLGVFAGGFDLAAAAAVAALPNERGGNLVSRLAVLVDQSLAQRTTREEEDAPRFTLLEIDPGVLRRATGREPRCHGGERGPRRLLPWVSGASRATPAGSRAGHLIRSTGAKTPQPAGGAALVSRTRRSGARFQHAEAFLRRRYFWAGPALCLSGRVMRDQETG